MATCRFTTILLLVSLPAMRALPMKEDLAKYANQSQIIQFRSGATDDSLGSVREKQRAVKRACQCVDGLCSCCTGNIMQNFVSYTPRQRGCLNISYDPDDFAFAMAISMNDRVLYKNTISGKNPRPLCVPLPRVQSAKFCVRLSNVYFVGRNLHACIDMETRWQDQQTFEMTFDCIRIGADGVKVLKPEEGGGISVGVPVKVTPSPDEYDEIPAEQPPEGEETTTEAQTEAQTEQPERAKPPTPQSSDATKVLPALPIHPPKSS